MILFIIPSDDTFIIWLHFYYLSKPLFRTTASLSEDTFSFWRHFLSDDTFSYWLHFLFLTIPFHSDDTLFFWRHLLFLTTVFLSDDTPSFRQYSFFLTIIPLITVGQLLFSSSYKPILILMKSFHIFKQYFWVAIFCPEFLCYYYAWFWLIILFFIIANRHCLSVPELPSD